VITVGVHARYETSFECALDYPNPVQDVQLTVEFESDGQEKRTVEGFWDGGRTWRARFSPDLRGHWTWRSRCSHSDDSGLHNQTDEFECSELSALKSPLHLGPLQVSPTRRYLIHSDGQPFFWLGDTAWNGPLLSAESDWAAYLSDRAKKGFNVIQFVATPWIGATGDATGRPAYLGQRMIRIEPAFFKRLDHRVDMINEFGMVAAPVLAWAAAWNPESVHLNPGNSLSDEQLIVLLRYLVSRYGAHQAIWILAGDGIYTGNEAERWRRIGRSAFRFTNRSATIHPAAKVWVAPEFRREPWFHFNGYQSAHGTDDDTFRWINEGPLSTNWRTEPACPHINLEPCYEDHISMTSGERINAYDVRSASYWSLLATPPAGVTYGAHGVWSWETTRELPLSHPHSGIAKPWYEAINLPGSHCMTHLKSIFTSVDWWRLRPCPELLHFQPGWESAARFVSAACSEERDLAMIYSPEGGSLQLNVGFLSREVTMQCFNPENGKLLWQRHFDENEKRSEETTDTGSPGDRVLVLRAS
jgi:hypothetical protein